MSAIVASPVLPVISYHRRECNKTHSCKDCKEKFTIFKHRHFCKMCKESICDDCTCTNYVLVKRNGINQWARFCEQCFLAHEQEIKEFQQKLNKKNAERLLEVAQTVINNKGDASFLDKENRRTPSININNDDGAEACIFACLAVVSLLAN